MPVSGLPVQRVRLRYCKGEPLRYISHLDMMRVWERALRRARVPVEYTHGFNPRPRISLACPLPTGVTSKAEDVDLYLLERSDPARLVRALNTALPPGVRVTDAVEVALATPALQSLEALVDYTAEIEGADPAPALEARLAALLAAERLPRSRSRKGEVVQYDLRPLVERVWLVGRSGQCWVVGMRLRSGPKGTGRPDELLAELGLLESATTLHRGAVEYAAT